MALKPLKPSKAKRQDKKRQIRDALEQQSQQRKGVEYPQPEPPAWKPLG